ncbi:MAG: MBL fold metallo-hydrolase [Thermoplasmata archaeon]
MQVQHIVDPMYDTNIFLVISETPILVDTGSGLSPKACISSISRFATLTEIDRIILTHRHIDHVGGAKVISEACNATLYASKGEAPSLLAGDQVTTAASMFGKRLEKLDVRALDYDETIDLGSGRLKVIHTPGHTEGSICLYEESTKSLFSGDTVFAHGGVGRWDFPTGDLNELVGSVEKLSEMPVENLYPGHGPVVNGNANLHIQASYRSLRVYKFV